MAKCNAPCWCKDMVIPPSLIEMIPSQLKGKVCICFQCINSYKRNSVLFESKYTDSQ
ncbi:MAG TPA: hypothetical protein EYQ50_25910 [Verrucomicrobiales bacterium]|nr:hypothetical protein [Verrucomicrobiales bacterium]HIL70069.1 hypothetical protein [Verrucomicrobiota bacterium]